MTYYELYCRDKSAMASALAKSCPYAECPAPGKDCGACAFERLGHEVPAVVAPGGTDGSGGQGIGGLLDYLKAREIDGRDAYMLSAGWLASGKGPLLCSREDIKALLETMVDYTNQ